jgi:hypothetical protein
MGIVPEQRTRLSELFLRQTFLSREGVDRALAKLAWLSAFLRWSLTTSLEHPVHTSYILRSGVFHVDLTGRIRIIINLADVTQLSSTHGKGDCAYACAASYHGGLDLEWLLLCRGCFINTLAGVSSD